MASKGGAGVETLGGAGAGEGDGVAEGLAIVRGERILSLTALLPKVGDLSKSTLWELVRAAAFPAPIQITVNRVGWLESEVDAWIARRRAGPRGVFGEAEGVRRGAAGSGRRQES